MKGCLVWILAEQFGGKVQDISFELLARGKSLAVAKGARLCAVILSSALPDEELRKLVEHGADCVLAMESELLNQFNIEPHAAAMLEAIEKYSPHIIIAGATSSGRTLMPYVAMKSYSGLTADCTILEIEPETGLLLQTRPAIGGNIMATIKTPGRLPQMATVRPRSTRSCKRIEGRSGDIIRHSFKTEKVTSNTRVVDFIPAEDEVSLQDAEKVVIIGRGIKKVENLEMIRDLCDVLGAALGATREVVDRGWLSYPHQVGLSGKTINPELCVSIGVSGAIQQLAGMQTSKKIIAINKDPDAQIFNTADFGIVGDLFEVVPMLIERIKKGALTW